MLIKHSEIEVFLGSNLNFTITVFTQVLANDLDICEKYNEPAKHYSGQFNQQHNKFEIIQNQFCEGSQIKKALKLTEQHVVPHF